MARKFIVTQACCGYTLHPEEKRHDKKYQFTKPINRGEYAEKDFTDLVGREFLETKEFQNLVKCGYIKIVEYKDISANYTK